MSTSYYSIPCQFCGTVVLRSVSVKKATCFDCKMKRTTQKEKERRMKKHNAI